MPNVMVTLADLAADPAKAMALSLEEATALLAQAGAIEAVLRARLVATANGVGVARPEAPTPVNPKARDRLLTLDEMVVRSRKSRGWFHVHWRKAFPTGLKKGRTVLVPESDFEKWLHRP